MPDPLGKQKGRLRMKYGVQKVWAEESIGKVEWCLLVTVCCGACASVLMAAWAACVGWSALIERLAQ